MNQQIKRSITNKAFTITSLYRLELSTIGLVHVEWSTLPDWRVIPLRLHKETKWRQSVQAGKCLRQCDGRRRLYLFSVEHKCAMKMMQRGDPVR